MSAADWDDRYRGEDLVWGIAANRWVEQELAGSTPGRVLDMACGEGRNSIWLAQHGWQVTGVDFSAEAITKARALAAEHTDPSMHPVEWICADATSFTTDIAFDVVILVYLQLPADQRRAAIAAAWAALATGGTLIVIAHHTDNLEFGVGGPRDLATLYTASDIATDLAAAGARVTVESSQQVLRPVNGADRPALDALFRGRKG